MPSRSASAQQPSSDSARREQGALRFSIFTGAAIGIMAVLWGLAAGSTVILFDGVYATLSLGLSWLSLRASRLVDAGPTKAYPFGREALAPLVIAIQGIALLGTCSYAILSSALTVLDGGSEVEVGSAFGYAVVSTLAASAVYLRLRRGIGDSELVRAEATQWLAGVGLSVAMVLAFGAVFILGGSKWENSAKFVDPILVIVACLAFIPAPINMVRTTVRELLEGAPAEEIQGPVRAAIHQVTLELKMPEPMIRMSKLGKKLYVEVDYLVDAGRYDTSDADHVRHAISDRLAELPHATWLNVDLSTDANWSQ